MSKWTTQNMPSQAGRTAVVTGTGGIGFEDALALAKAKANVIIAGRNPDKGAEAVARIRQTAPGARIRFGQVDLGNLVSIARFAQQLAAEEDQVDLLINNAGVMMPPKRQVTSDGFELQLGTNHLGHFALTAHLLPLLKKGKRPRVISLGSVAARNGAIDFADLQAERAYNPMKVYSQSKLACIMFAFELSRRSRQAGWGIESLAAHPGISRTDLIPNQASRWSFNGIMRHAMPFLFQPASQGALPTLYAATDPQAQDGGHYGPDGLGGTRGYPTLERPPERAQDIAVAARLWEISEQLTKTSFR
ncbi:NAD(P)-dependent dehydrogenase, short-chain alcohol dehydrogenase family [Devosia crocina]|uniref:NAD(P)-dependent dehydrogenase, short-chain alcohol dehydrogenase family n=1 Tax=Devosia crocina TaxID=429728 RepID=A0A1I7NJ52_9HYPH|nr:SDR family oxidoreductase [Devosia crocina]SFV34675.1 NAD(P)-dependent dehydrogenase, short-chain alcohol dehydrogenase family [Devosia crocina]